MGDLLTIGSALLGAAIYAALGIAGRDRSKPEDKFSPDRLIPTFVTTLVGAVLLFLSDQEVNATNVTTFVAGNVGLAAGADKTYKYLQSKILAK